MVEILLNVETQELLDIRYHEKHAVIRSWMLNYQIDTTKYDNNWRIVLI